MTRNGIAVTGAQAEVYDTFKQFGVALPDHALVPLAQHASHIRQSSSGIRSRRHELTDKGLVVCVGDTITGSGRKANVWMAV